MLGMAKKNAALGGFKGARYPWESADTGLEETPPWGYDYKGNRVRIWTGEIELHITGDVAYALREYVRASGDTKFFCERAAEIILETARFWVSRLEYNATKDRYEINDVIGPDEFHEHVNNNAYTNCLAQWNIRYAAECARQLGIDCDETEAWEDIAEKIYIPISENGRIIEQFEGYFGLEDKLIEAFDENNMPLWPEGVDITALNNYTLVKQADVIMLLHLLNEQFDLETMRENYIYYENRTMHKSSLGPSIYALMGVKTGQHAKAYDNFHRTVMTDIADNQGNSSEGIHAAAAGGSWLAVFYGFCGAGVSADGGLSIDPWLPRQWQSIKLNFFFKSRHLRLAVTADGAHIERLSGPDGLKVIVSGKEIII
jgi:kojibiose phosphorylase